MPSQEMIFRLRSDAAGFSRGLQDAASAAARFSATLARTGASARELSSVTSAAGRISTAMGGIQGAAGNAARGFGSAATAAGQFGTSVQRTSGIAPGFGRAFVTAFQRVTHSATSMSTGVSRATASMVSGFGQALSAAANFGARLSSIQTTTVGFQAASRVVSGVQGITDEFANFERGMLRFGAVSRLSGGDLERMRALIERLAVDTSFSSNEVLEAAFSLASLGVSGAESFEILLPVMTEAALAMNTTVPRAAETMLGVMRQFEIPFSRAREVADLMANAYTRSSLNIERFSVAMQYAGPIAGLYGESLADTTALLALISDRGIDASIAGTQLRMAMSQLTEGSDAQNEILRALGLTLEDVSIRSHGFIGVLENLSRAGMTIEQAGEFFGIRSGPIVSLLVSLGNSSSDASRMMREMSARMSEAGTAARVAGNMQSGYSFAIEQLSGAYELFRINLGEAIVRNLSLETIIRRISGHFETLATIVRTIDFGLLAGIGGRIFNFDDLSENLSRVFTRVFPAAVDFFANALVYGGLTMVSAIAERIPEWGAIFVQAAGSGFFALAGVAGNMFAEIVTSTFTGIVYSVNLLIASIQDLFASVLSSLPGMGAGATALRRGATERRGLTSEQIESTFGLGVFREEVRLGLVAASARGQRELSTIVDAVTPAFETAGTAISERATEARESVDFSGSASRLAESFRSVPTDRQIEAFGDFSMELLSSLQVAEGENFGREGSLSAIMTSFFDFAMQARRGAVTRQWEERSRRESEERTRSEAQERAEREQRESSERDRAAAFQRQQETEQRAADARVAAASERQREEDRISEERNRRIFIIQGAQDRRSLEQQALTETRLEITRRTAQARRPLSREEEQAILQRNLRSRGISELISVTSEGMPATESSVRTYFEREYERVRAENQRIPGSTTVNQNVNQSGATINNWRSPGRATQIEPSIAPNPRGTAAVPGE